MRRRRRIDGGLGASSHSNAALQEIEPPPSDAVIAFQNMLEMRCAPGRDKSPSWASRPAMSQSVVFVADLLLPGIPTSHRDSTTSDPPGASTSRCKSSASWPSYSRLLDLAERARRATPTSWDRFSAIGHRPSVPHDWLVAYQDVAAQHRISPGCDDGLESAFT